MPQNKKPITLKRREFVCFCCGEIRTRGNYVRVNHGDDRGIVVKTCKSERCKVEAADGDYQFKLEG